MPMVFRGALIATMGTSFILNCGGGGGGTPTPPPPSPPVISSFTASPTSITVGQSSTLSWSVSGATGLSIAPAVGTVSGSSTSVGPIATTTFTLTASNTGGTTLATTTVTVNIAPSITSHPSDQAVTAGQMATFTVTASGIPTPTYQWQRSSDGGTFWTNVTTGTGETSSS